MRFPPLLLLTVVGLFAQVSDEQKELNAALGEAGSSPIEYLRVIEHHLQKYPDSPRRPELERAATRAAMQAHRGPETILWGERVLAREGDDVAILDAVAQSLILSDSAEDVERALKYARRIQAINRDKSSPSGIARGLILEAGADGVLGHTEESLDLSRSAFRTYPSAEAARQIAIAAERLGKLDEAARALADAFTIPDARTTDADRARNRALMGKLYRQAHGSEAGLGDILLQAYDRNQALIHERTIAQPLPAETDPMARDLETLDGGKFAMADLKSKIIVLDFWATWCVPCREQHPLLQKVRDHFQQNPEVKFLSLNADEDRANVKPFLAESKWTDDVYYSSGMDRALVVGSFPTVIILDKHGKIFSRLAGFVPERFIETLTSRIQSALEAK